MNKLALFFCIWLYLSLPGYAQQPDSLDRKKEIEKIMENIFAIEQFQYVAKELEMSMDELSDYPVIFPVKRAYYGNYLSSAFGKRMHPIHHTVQNHTGIDIAEPKGNPVYATGNGVVVNTGWNRGYGNFVEIRHKAGFSTFYAHLDRGLVAAGDRVVMGEHIACVGNTGISTGSHLHYEVRKNGRFLDAEGWCWGLASIINQK